jgi:hypothetical protein
MFIAVKFCLILVLISKMNKDIPLLEYCKLSRASKLLNCEIEDFLHWDEINAISLYFHFQEPIKALIKINNLDQLLTGPINNDEIILEQGYSRIHINSKDFLKNNNDSENYCTLKAFVSGLWRIYNISTFGKAIHSLPHQNNQTLLVSHGEKVKAIIHSPEQGIVMNTIVNIAPQDLIILKNDIRKIRHYSGQSMPTNLDVCL